MTQMIPFKRYVVTKSSDDQTFRKGDHIYQHECGDIMCREAQGWIQAEDVPSATIGMEVKLDLEWAQRHKEALLRELALLEETYKE